METTDLIGSAMKARKRKKRIKKAGTFIGANGLLIGGLAFTSIMGILLLGSMGGAKQSQVDYDFSGGAKSLSTSTLQWREKVVSVADGEGVPELVPYIMAIIEVESKGLLEDVMQSSESAGLPPNTLSAEESIKQGIVYLKNGFTRGEAFEFTDIWGIIQSYNFGLAYVDYLASGGMTHSVDIGENYSREVVAPSLGNTSGSTYSYVNEVSQSFGKTYLYSNGGNYYYADLVKQYVGSSGGVPVGDETFQIIMEEALKYEGYAYQWGGAHPSTSFDCSGLMVWAYEKAGIHLPRTAQQQYNATTPVSIEDAQPGDLIFFAGTYSGGDFITHVGIYVDETRMYDANGSGVSYSNWATGYWNNHYVGIGRVVN